MVGSLRYHDGNGPKLKTSLKKWISILSISITITRQPFTLSNASEVFFSQIRKIPFQVQEWGRS